MSETSARHQEGIDEALARVAARLAAGAAPDDATARLELLATRATALAMPLEEHDEAALADQLEVLVFRVGDERLGMALGAIVAIVRASVVTPLPRAMAPVHGVTAWRGRPLTVLWLGAGRTIAEPGNRLIVLGDGRRAVLGLLVDGIDDTVVVKRSTLTPATGGARGALALGITDDALLVLDPDAMLTVARPEP
jgi:chemotaxis signal transduction protein